MKLDPIAETVGSTGDAVNNQISYAFSYNTRGEKTIAANHTWDLYGTRLEKIER